MCINFQPILSATEIQKKNFLDSCNTNRNKNDDVVVNALSVYELSNTFEITTIAL